MAQLPQPERRTDKAGENTSGMKTNDQQTPMDKFRILARRLLSVPRKELADLAAEDRKNPDRASD